MRISRQDYTPGLIQAVCEDLLEASPTHASEYQWRELLRKFQSTGTSSKDTAIQNFRALNERASAWEPHVPQCMLDELLVNEFAREFWHHTACIGSVLSPIPIEGRFGTGSSSGHNFETSYCKYESEMTTTNRTLYSLYVQAIRKDPLRLSVERERRTNHEAFQIVQGSRLTTVPKNSITDRTICVEPSLNTYHQLHIGERIANYLWKAFSIDLATQPDINRLCATLGSLPGWDLCTIDLSNASDGITVGFMERYSDPVFKSILDLSRVPRVEIDGTFEDLHIYSSMGNGFNFPLQTLIFATCISVANKLSGDTWLGCFGDDIVCQYRTARLVLRLLSALGFTPNSAKTFLSGPFRESCGVDALSGVNIRPLYIKEPAATIPKLSTYVNMFVDFGYRTGISCKHTVKYALASGCFPVPPHEPIDAGIHMPLSCAPHIRFHKSGVGCVVRYKILAPKVRQDFQLDSAAIIAALQGGCDEVGLTSRRNGAVRYRSRNKATSAWDTFMCSPLKEVTDTLDECTVIRPYNYECWEAYIAANTTA